MLKEAGSSTVSSQVVINVVKRRASKDSSPLQNSLPKAANQTQEDGDEDVNMECDDLKKTTQNGELKESSEKPRLTKTRSSGVNGCELGDRFLKNSTKVSPRNTKTSKSVEESIEAPKSDELPQNKDGSTNVSLNYSTRAEATLKKNVLQKETSSTSVSKPRRAEARMKQKSLDKNSEVMSHENHNSIPRIKISPGKAEEI